MLSSFIQMRNAGRPSRRDKIQYKSTEFHNCLWNPELQLNFVLCVECCFRRPALVNRTLKTFRRSSSKRRARSPSHPESMNHQRTFEPYRIWTTQSSKGIRKFGNTNLKMCRCDNKLSFYEALLRKGRQTRRNSRARLMPKSNMRVPDSCKNETPSFISPTRHTHATYKTFTLLS